MGDDQVEEEERNYVEELPTKVPLLVIIFNNYLFFLLTFLITISHHEMYDNLN